MNQEFSQLSQEIQKHRSFAVVCHKKPDGDAVGCVLAFASYLESLGKQVQKYCVDEVPSYLSFLPESELIKKPKDEFWQNSDAVVMLDCGDLGMSGIDREELQDRVIVNIDHHISNSGYGAVNLVQHTSAATAEILYNYFEEVQFKIDKPAATNLLCGVYTDTDAFTNLGTTPESLRVSSELLKLGANFKEITAQTMRNKSVASLKLWGRALERLRFDAKKGIAVTVIKHTDFDECGAEPDDTEGVANLLNHLSDVKMAMVLRDLGDGMVKGSLRTTKELIDVSQIAKLMGGGGHAKAAGFTVKGKVIESDNGWKIVE
ncbi:MAG: bifunctional oligoribonuclease/PAP phosphatase NrnA [Patescibacteria group bacterium]|jgi:phosphoesterase RecJ-like protein|nr:bifunctional oligoribonuclease/PAP phosphatase NrnA [Patescibacteria group bacterium]|tara:strand:- start:2028 stop:2981 length:954 start_codon:yes stop_codon:yes gene_type:complete